LIHFYKRYSNEWEVLIHVLMVDTLRTKPNTMNTVSTHSRV